MNIQLRSIAGLFLLLLGAVLLLNQGNDLGVGTIFAYFWPSLFVIPLGLFFHWLYFVMLERKGAGVLVPGGILLTTGIVCQIAMLFNNWEYMWPGFIFAVAVGLFEFYWFGGKNRWLLIPINILVALSLLFFIVFSVGTLVTHLSEQPIIAIAMVAVGLLLLFVRRKEV